MDEGRAAIEAAIADGRGLAKLRAIVEAQGGDPRVVDEPARLPRAARTVDVPAPASGIVEAIDAEVVGLAAMALGAGRAKVEDRIDPAAGIVVHKRIGERVERGDPLCTLHGGGAGEPPERVVARAAGAWRLGFGPVRPPPLLIERMAP